MKKRTLGLMILFLFFFAGIVFSLPEKCCLIYNEPNKGCGYLDETQCTLGYGGIYFTESCYEIDECKPGCCVEFDDCKIKKKILCDGFFDKNILDAAKCSSTYCISGAAVPDLNDNGIPDNMEIKKASSETNHNLQEMCGDGIVQAEESCELPNTNNNNYCPQTISLCNSAKTQTRDSKGYCNKACECTQDALSTPKCVKGVCGAVCETNSDCNDYNPNTIDSCTNECSCAHIINSYCGDGIVQAKESCELPNTNNNNYCPQTTSLCNDAKTQTRDSKGYCNNACECTQDALSAPKCVKGICGAVCETNSDCNDYNPNTIDACDDNCNCIHYVKEACGDGIIQTGEECEKDIDCDDINSNTIDECTSDCKCTNTVVLCSDSTMVDKCSDYLPKYCGKNNLVRNSGFESYSFELPKEEWFFDDWEGSTTTVEDDSLNIEVEKAPLDDDWFDFGYSANIDSGITPFLSIKYNVISIGEDQLYFNPSREDGDITDQPMPSTPGEHIYIVDLRTLQNEDDCQTYFNCIDSGNNKLQCNQRCNSNIITRVGLFITKSRYDPSNEQPEKLTGKLEWPQEKLAGKPIPVTIKITEIKLENFPFWQPYGDDFEKAVGSEVLKIPGQTILHEISKDSRSGKNSYEIKTEPSESWLYKGLYSKEIKVMPNTDYLLSAWVKTGELIGTSELSLHCHNAEENKGLAVSANFHYEWNSTDLAFTPNNGWTKKYGEFITLPDTNHCHILAFFNEDASGTFWVDDIRLEEKNSLVNLDDNCQQCSCTGNQMCLEEGKCNSLKKIELSINKKNPLKYSDKEIFLISDEEWENVLSLVPVTTWTDNSVQKYPALIYHKEDDSFDPESIIYFLQDYKPGKITSIGKLHQDFANLLAAEPELGAGIGPEKISSISPADYFSYWETYDTIVYSEHNYETALLASTYASLINAPLVIKDSPIYSANVLPEKNIICIGNTDYPKCAEKYNIEELRQKYYEITKTDKIILVNPLDIGTFIEEEFQPYQSLPKIRRLYTKTSLAAPFLASAKQELMISYPLNDYENPGAITEIAKFIGNEIRSHSPDAKYLTIISDPKAIPIKKFGYSDGKTEFFIAADQNIYAKLMSEDNRFDRYLFAGRIMGISSTDVSTYVARDIFYSSFEKNKNVRFMASSFDDNIKQAVAWSMKFLKSGYISQANIISEGKAPPFDPDLWKNTQLIWYSDHGKTDWAGISSEKIPKLYNSLVFANACLTCSGENYTTFCTNAIRKGAIGFIGALSTAKEKNYVWMETGNKIYYESKSLGESFKEAYSLKTYYNGIGSTGYDKDNYMITLIGDPTLEINPPHRLIEKLVIEEKFPVCEANIKLTKPYPNPFYPKKNKEIKIDAEVNYPNPIMSCLIEFKVINVKGEEIFKGVTEQYPAGKYTKSWNCESTSPNSEGNLASTGVYYFLFQAGTKKIKSEKFQLTK